MMILLNYLLYHAWRGKSGKYKDEAGFCKSAKLDEIVNMAIFLLEAVI